MKRIVLVLFLLISLDAIGQSSVNWHRPETTIPYRNVNGKLIVDVEIGGKVRPFLFDTGFSLSAITDDLYVELGLDSLKTLRMIDANGVVDPVIVARTDNLRMGEWSIPEKEVIVIPSVGVPLHCFGIEGVIGSDLLQGRVVRISPRDGTIRLAESAGSFSLRRRDGAKLIVRNNIPYFRADVRNGRKRSGHWVEFDTGANNYALRGGDLDRLRRKQTLDRTESATGSAAIGAHGLEKENIQSRGIIARTEIAGAVLNEVPFVSTQGTASLFGTVWLDYGTMTLDYGGKRIWFEPFAEKQSMIGERDTRAVTPVWNENGLVVGIVWSESLRPLVRSGDHIVSLDGRPAETYNLCDFMTGRVDLRKVATLGVETASGEIIEITL